MKIAMFTNTYFPHIGGVAKSVKTLEDACRQQGHEVRVVAPEFQDQNESPEILRVPAIQHFNGRDFSLRIPLPNLIHDFIQDFEPDLIHSHHPFLLGDSALREARKMRVPIVFTHHTLYECYAHYVPLNSPTLLQIAIQLTTEYGNLCDQIIAPSGSVARLLRERGVRPPIQPIPTGIDIPFFATGRGQQFREIHGIAQDAIVIGHVGRLATEKNLIFLTEAVAVCLKQNLKTIFLGVGDGEAHDEMLAILRRGGGNRQRVHLVGKLSGQDLADAYAAMDCFVFASQTETQGLVLAEAMAAGKPVVALDGPGVREIVHDGQNGRLLSGEASSREFASALLSILSDPELLSFCAENARLSTEHYSLEHTAQRMLNCYQHLIASHQPPSAVDLSRWDQLLTGIGVEWDLFIGKMSAAVTAVAETSATQAHMNSPDHGAFERAAAAAKFAASASSDRPR